MSQQQSQEVARSDSEWAGVLRSLAAAAGALVGGLVAVPLAAVLFVFLFERVGVHIVESVISGAMEDVHGIEALFVGLFIAVAAVAVAAIVIVALVAPVFVLLPMVAVAIALRLARAGLIMRTILLTLAMVLGLAIGLLLVANVTGLRVPWLVVAMVGVAGAIAVSLSASVQVSGPG